MRELDVTVVGPNQEAIASDSDVASADKVSAAKRVDRGIDDDKFFSDVDIASPPAPAAEGTDDLELGAIATDVLICVLSLCGRTNALAFFRKASRVLNRQGRMGYLQRLHPASPGVHPHNIDRRSPILPPGTRPHPAQSNENHW